MAVLPAGELSEGRFLRIVAVSVVVAGFLAYSNTLANGFVWDDVSSFVLHQHVHDPGQFFQLFREDQHAFGRGQGNFYRPLVAASFMLDYALSRPDPAPVPGAKPPEPGRALFHVTNILWHVAAALGLLALLTRLRAPRFVRAAVPILYVVHPLHTEAVAYVSGRADPMAAAFMYWGLWLALSESGGARRWAATLSSGLAFGCALLSKEAASIYPFLLLLLLLAAPLPPDQPDARRFSAARLAPLGLSVVILAVYAFLRMTVLRFAPASSLETSFAQRLVETLQAFATYIGLLFVPANLHMERTLAGAGFLRAAAGAVLFAGVLALAAVSWARGTRRVTLGLGWFLLTWLPISGLFPLNAPLAEHWMYVPMAGFIWAVLELAWSAAKRPAARQAIAAAVFAAFVAFLAVTAHRNRDWRDNEAIFLATLDGNPASIRVHYNLAVTYEDLLGNLPAARRHYHAVVDLYRDRKKQAGGAEQFWDDELESHLSLGKIYARQGLYDQAAEHYGTVLRIKPEEKNRPLIGAAAFGLGQCYLASGDMQRAIASFKQALSARPDLRPDVERVLRDGVT